MEHAAQSIVDRLLLYGPLGIICIILLLAVIYLQRRNEKQEERHRLEMNTLMERHMTKAETFVTKIHELGDRQASVLESLVKRRS